MPTVVATPGAADANAYATVAEVDAFADQRLETDAWDAEADPDAKARAVIQATSLLDPRAWLGTRASQTQALRWPRYGVQDRDGFTVDGSTIPKGVKDGTAEFAILLHASTIATGSDPQAASQLDQFSELKVGEITIKLRGQGQSGGLGEAELPPSVELYVGQYLSGGGSSSTIRLRKA